ncbi:MAG: PEGA domain-containing protein [Kiritimatiellae bacterium]|nr:PEGA domain-containing protein [Kiritimatiellia bacterium]
MRNLVFILIAALSLGVYAEETETGLLLVTSDPSGAEITESGVSLGTTPRLITILDTESRHKLTLTKNGYQQKKVEFKFNGRTPLVINEKLVLDSGLVKISSDPVGAKVMINGLDRGVTPIEVSGIPRGLTTITLSMDGFQSEKRELSMRAGEEQNLFLKLSPLPGTLMLVSVPDGARFYLNDKFEGKSPLVLKSTPPGVYNVRAELDGHGTINREITIANGASVREEFKLTNVMGRLEVRSSPAEAQVYLDGKLVGTTVKITDDDEFSAILPINAITQGEHVLVLKKEGFADSTRHPKIQNSKTSKANVRMRRVFTPDIEIVTPTGTHRGVYVSSDSEKIEIEVSMGIQRSFSKRDIIKLNYLDKDPLK